MKKSHLDNFGNSVKSGFKHLKNRNLSKDAFMYSNSILIEIPQSLIYLGEELINQKEIKGKKNKTYMVLKKIKKSNMVNIFIKNNLLEIRLK